MKVIIPASGIGKRFIDAGYKDTKPLIPVTDAKRIIDYVFDIFDRKNDEFFIITSSATHNEMKEFLEKTDLNYHLFNLETSSLGPVGAIVDCIPELSKHISGNDKILISYCDYGMEWDYQDFKVFIDQTDPDGCIPCYTGYHPHLEPVENVYACCKTYDNSLRMYNIFEKYVSQDKFNEYWSPGVYYFKTFDYAISAFNSMIEDCNKLGGEYYVSLAYQYILNDEITVYPYVDKFYQFGTPKDFEIAKDMINKRNKLRNDEVQIDNTVVLSAGKGERFFKLGYTQPKPFIPLGNSDFIHTIAGLMNPVTTNMRFVGSEEHKLFWDNSSLWNVKLIEPNKIGAAYSYKEGASDIEGSTLIVPCDLVAKHITAKFKLFKNTCDAIIFTAPISEYAKENPNSFAWVQSSKHKVQKVSVKERLNNNQDVLIGSFYVRDNKMLLKYIDKIMSENKTVNGEFYLDTAFKEMVDDGLNVLCIKLDSYISLGTPQEYKQNGYWL